MDVNFVLLLCIALILVAYTNKVNGEAEVVSSSIPNSNLTDSRFGGSETVTDSKSIDHSNNTTDDPQLKKKGSDLYSSKSEGTIESDESKSTKMEAITISNSSRKKEGFHGEGCDPSNMCTDKEEQFVACLRVPGNDGPHLSLLIQNKGISALQVTITAPGFVRLEKNEVHLLKNENTKVKVSIKKRGSNSNNRIILTSRKGNCSLELKDLTGTPETENEDTVTVSRPSILGLRPRTFILIIMIFILVLALVIIPMIIHVYKKKSQENKNYQRVDMELPVSGAAMVSKSSEETVDDGWDNNWGDDWDDENGDGDEEQAVLSVTPSVSARGLASRRLGKEGWKD